MASDIDHLKRSLKSMKPVHFVIIAAIVGGIIGLHKLSGLSLSSIDRTDYKAVAVNFIESNATVANKLGKIKSYSLIGTGGTRSPSYNVFNVRGENRSGMMQLTLKKNGEGLWYVTEASLSFGGSEYSIPISRSDESRSIKLFK